MSAGKGPWPDPLRLDGADYNAHHFAGYLFATIQRGDVITVEGWNEALLASREFAQKEAERAETAKRNAIAARRRGQAQA